MVESYLRFPAFWPALPILSHASGPPKIPRPSAFLKLAGKPPSGPRSPARGGENEAHLSPQKKAASRSPDRGRPGGPPRFARWVRRAVTTNRPGRQLGLRGQTFLAAACSVGASSSLGQEEGAWLAANVGARGSLLNWKALGPVGSMGLFCGLVRASSVCCLRGLRLVKFRSEG